MRLPGAGRRAAAALLALSTLAFAGSSLASDKDDARRSKHEAASAVTKPGDSTHTPSTKSIPRSPISPGARFEPYSSISGVTSPTADEKLLVELVNVERTARKLKPVAWDGLLSGLARMHAVDMRSVRKASHESSSDGATFRTRLARTPYRARAAAENVAYNANVVKAHRALMDSPGHRRNILDPDLSAIGTAVVVDAKDDWVWVVEDFATPTANVSDSEAVDIMRKSLMRSRRSLPEDKALSRRLEKMVEEMADSGAVQRAVDTGIGPGWTLAFTALDPTEPPKSAIERARTAESYALAVTFRKTQRYPFGAYWAILFLKGAY